MINVPGQYTAWAWPGGGDVHEGVLGTVVLGGQGSQGRGESYEDVHGSPDVVHRHPGVGGDGEVDVERTSVNP